MVSSTGHSLLALDWLAALCPACHHGFGDGVRRAGVHLAGGGTDILRIMSLAQITRLPAEAFAAAVPDLADVLVDAVEGGASVGFVLPFAADAARRWWATVESGVADGRTLLWVARDEVGVVGTVQVKLELGYPNGRHRAEVSKLLVHRRGRGRGLGRALLATAEQGAIDSGCTLLVLDTETGGPAEDLYRSAGFVELGVMPEHSADPWGALKPTTYFYKLLAKA